MKKLFLSISFLLLLGLVNGQLFKLCEGCFANKTISICEGCFANKSLYVSTYETYEQLIKKNPKKYSNIPIISICQGCFANETISICEGCFANETISITNDPNLADIVIFVDEDIINNYSDFPLYKTILKNYLSQIDTPNKKSSHSSSESGYKTKIDEDNDDILKLDNGAIVEISYGYLGYLGYRKDCVVYKSGSGWKIWIEGKKSFACTILKEPSYVSTIDVKEVTISKISDSGDIIFLADGSVYEVSYQSYETSLWLGYSSALLINEYQIINLDEGGEIIDVFKIK